MGRLFASRGSFADLGAASYTVVIRGPGSVGLTSFPAEGSSITEIGLPTDCGVLPTGAWSDWQGASFSDLLCALDSGDAGRALSARLVDIQ